MCVCLETATKHTTQQREREDCVRMVQHSPVCVFVYVCVCVCVCVLLKSHSSSLNWAQRSCHGAQGLLVLAQCRHNGSDTHLVADTHSHTNHRHWGKRRNGSLPGSLCKCVCVCLCATRQWETTLASCHCKILLEDNRCHCNTHTHTHTHTTQWLRPFTAFISQNW